MLALNQIEWELAWFLGAAFAFAELLGLLTAVHAVMHARTAQGATAWTIALLTLAWLALPLYWVFGRSKFHGYIKARRSGDQQLAHLIENFKQEYSDFPKLDPEDQTPVSVLEQLSRLPLSARNRARLLIDGEDTFRAIFEGLESATEYVLIQFFIVRDDELGRDLADRLMQCARRGVRVYFLYDEIGCHSLPGGYWIRLRKAGVVVSAFHSNRGRWNRFQLNFRNHRKIVIVDGRLAFVGGHNVGEEYLGRHPRFGRWRDTHLEMEGPGAICVQVSFLEDWFWATRQVPHIHWRPVPAKEGNQRLMVLPTGPADQLETCALFFSYAIQLARKRIWITSPYFVPDSQIMTSLQLAALRGVDVRIMLPGKPDHMLVYLSSFAYIKETEAVGVRFFRYQKGFLHQKVLLVDDRIGCVGTANLDNRSFRLNFEISLIAFDSGFAAEVAAMLEQDFDGCLEVDEQEYDRRSFPFRLAVRASKLLAPIQ